jgi:hypothetical protein
MNMTGMIRLLGLAVALGVLSLSTAYEAGGAPLMKGDAKATAFQQPSTSKPVDITMEKLTISAMPPLTSLSPSQAVDITMEKLTISAVPPLTSLSPSQAVDITMEKLTISAKPPLAPLSP